MKMHLAIAQMFALFLLFSTAGNAQGREEDWESREFSTEYQRIRVVRILDGLEHPWSLAFLPAGGKLIAERPGRLYFAEGNEKTRISGLPDIYARGQGGLLDISLHPDYEESGWMEPLS